MNELTFHNYNLGFFSLILFSRINFCKIVICGLLFEFLFLSNDIGFCDQIINKIEMAKHIFPRIDTIIVCMASTNGLNKWFILIATPLQMKSILQSIYFLRIYSTCDRINTVHCSYRTIVISKSIYNEYFIELAFFLHSAIYYDA